MARIVYIRTEAKQFVLVNERFGTEGNTRHGAEAGAGVGTAPHTYQTNSWLLLQRRTVDTARGPEEENEICWLNLRDTQIYDEIFTE